MTKKILILPGDGIGQEVTASSIETLNYLINRYSLDFEIQIMDVGGTAYDLHGSPIPNDVLNEAKKSDAILFGAIGDPKYDNNPKAKIRPEDGLLEMRKYLGLYANVRPIKVYESLINASPLKANILNNTDFVVFFANFLNTLRSAKSTRQRRSFEVQNNSSRNDQLSDTPMDFEI